jgi:hypothetical protein
MNDREELDRLVRSHSPEAKREQVIEALRRLESEQERSALGRALEALDAVLGDARYLAAALDEAVKSSSGPADVTGLRTSAQAAVSTAATACSVSISTNVTTIQNISNQAKGVVFMLFNWAITNLFSILQQYGQSLQVENWYVEGHLTFGGSGSVTTPTAATDSGATVGICFAP